MKKLTGQKLADVYAYEYGEYVREQSGVEYHPMVYASYCGGGWIRLSGSNLPPHKDLREMYPNGWTLGATVRSKKAREFVLGRMH